VDPLAYIVAARTRSYKVDRAAVRRDLRVNDPKIVEESKREFGGYDVAEFKLVPISKIHVPSQWHPTRGSRIQEAIDSGKPLPPVKLIPIRGRYEINDGIHRVNVSIANGFSHIPAIVTHQVETPDEMDVLRDTPILEDGSWVKLHEPMDGREYGWVDGHLTVRTIRNGRRHAYSIALVKRGDTYPDYVDLLDTSFEPVQPPLWGPKLKEDLE